MGKEGVPQAQRVQVQVTVPVPETAVDGGRDTTEEKVGGTGSDNQLDGSEGNT